MSTVTLILFNTNPPTEPNQNHISPPPIREQSINHVRDANGRLHIVDTALMSYHRPTVTSGDFIASLRQAQRIAADVRRTLDAAGHPDVVFFPYSVFYVFYEQYLTVWSDSLFSLGISLAAIAVVTFVLTGFDAVSALLVVVMVAMIVVNMGGLMWLLALQLNAVSLVNLVVVSGWLNDWCHFPPTRC